MALSTQNIYGNITISDEAVSMLTTKVALDCYGIVELVSRRLSDSVLSLFNKVPISKGIKVDTMDNRIFIDLYVTLKAGVNKEAVISSLKSTVIYNISEITGMRVKSVNVHVVGVRL